jgi:predicted dehydrogenase
MIRIGVLCPSDIAFRRFLPSLKEATDFQYVGVAVASPEEWFCDDLGKVDEEKEKAERFVNAYSGKIFYGYETMIRSSEVDAIYIPLPPAMHFEWAKKALLNGKHVLLEKPFATSLKETKLLLDIADKNNLAVHEDYMFVYHSQLEAINEIVCSGEIGDVRLYRISFGFPRRDKNDFRYNKNMGGGALLDAGGYTIKMASTLLGSNCKMVAATANYIPDFEVDMYSSATMVNEDGVVAQLAFGMDNDYKCDLEIWGSKGTLTATRVMTAPTGFVPSCIIKKNQEFETRKLPADDAFLKSIQWFGKCINDNVVRKENYQKIEQQAVLVEEFKMVSVLKL